MVGKLESFRVAEALHTATNSARGHFGATWFAQDFRKTWLVGTSLARNLENAWLKATWLAQNLQQSWLEATWLVQT